MKMRQKSRAVLSVILALLIFTAVFPATVFAAIERPEDRIEYDKPKWDFWDSLSEAEKVALLEKYAKMTLAEWKALYGWEKVLVIDNLRRYVNLETDEWAIWWNSLSYEEQMKNLRDDWNIQKTLEKGVADRKAAEAAALAARPITLRVNGTTVKTDSPPVIQDGRTLAPMRAIVEALGYLVSWDSATQTIKIYHAFTENLVISMKIGSNIAKVSSSAGDSAIMDERIMEVPAKLINGRTMVPVRFIAESLGCTVKWDEATRTVSITQAAG